MKKEIVDKKSIVQFDSINEFYKYLCDTPFNEAFRWARHSSTERSESFTGTKSFDEAVELLKNGWNEMAQKITQKLLVNEKKTAYVNKRKNVTAMAGYQPIVPLYLAGAPNNMVSTKTIPVKQKVVNITKSLNYSGDTSKETILSESIKALQIVRKLEAIGYRVNLNIVLGSKGGLKANDQELYAKVCIKKANERLNISKLAFPMVHPSMLRRLFFRYIEVCPEATRAYVRYAYGFPISATNMKKVFTDDIIIPAIFNCNIDEVHTLDDLVKKCGYC